MLSPINYETGLLPIKFSELRQQKQKHLFYIYYDKWLSRVWFHYMYALNITQTHLHLASLFFIRTKFLSRAKFLAPFRHIFF